MTNFELLPDWVTAVPVIPSVHNEPARAGGPIMAPLTWQQMQEFFAKFLEAFIRRVVEAVVGFFVPGAGSAFEQLTNWANTLADTLGIPVLGDIIHAITGLFSGDIGDLTAWFTDLLGLLGNPLGLGSGDLGSIIGSLGDVPLLGPIFDFVQSIIDTITGAGSGIGIPDLAAWFTDLLALLGNPSGLGSGDLGGILGSLGDIPLLGTLVQWVQEIIDTIFHAITGLGSTGNLVNTIFDALTNIPFLNILGIGGPSTIGGSFQSTWDNLIGGFVGLLGSGAGLADLFNVSQQVSSNAALGGFSWDILGILSNKPFWGGLLPTGTSNVPMPLHVSTLPTFAVTQSTATMGFKHIEQSAPLAVVSWTGSGLTNITDFFINIYKMASDGVLNLVHASANIVGDVNPALGINLYELPVAIASVATETYGVEFAVRGSGTYDIVGYQTGVPNHPTVYPRNLGAVRNSGTSAPPSTIAAGSVVYPTNPNNVPTFEVAASSGEFNNHEPTLRQYLVAGSFSTPSASWANHIEVIALGGGGGGRNGQVGSDGNGGAAGHWTTTTWARGTDYTGTPTISISVATGGAPGTNGAASVVSITGHTVTATGGAGATGGNIFGNHSGASPGNQTYGINPVPPPYVGGGIASGYGTNGAAPGGGGAGGSGSFLSGGGAGAPGAVWIRYRQ